MKSLLLGTLIALGCYLTVEAARVEKVRRSRRDFEGLRNKRDLEGAGRAISLHDLKRDIDDDPDVGLVPANEVYTTPKGVSRLHLTETFCGLEVRGTGAEAELDENGQPTGQLDGKLCNSTGLHTDIPDCTACQRDEAALRELMFMAEVGKPNLEDGVDGVELKPCQRLVYNKNHTSYLAYECSFLYNDQEGMVNFPVYVFAACTLDVLTYYNKIEGADFLRREILRRGGKRQSREDCVEPTSEPRPTSDCEEAAVGKGGNTKVGLHWLGVSPMCLDVTMEDGLCVMENEWVKVVDNKNTEERWKADPVKFKCSLGYDDPINDAYGVAMDALYFGTKAGAFYWEKFGVRALDHKPNMVVHYGNAFGNAFWNGRNMYFGDGSSYFYPLVNCDVSSHELAHGFTSTRSNLEYRSESGGINEAFSDIAGETIEYYALGHNDWKLGTEIIKNPDGALRYMYDPPLDGRSIGHVDDYYEGMDVHYSSGIFNKAFHQMVTVQGMHIYHAFECFMEANMEEWNTNTGFVEGACDVVKTCYDNGFDSDKVKAAFDVVGVSTTECDVDDLSTLFVLGFRDIKVSSARKPIFEIDNVATSMTFTATTTAEGEQILIEICSDELCRDVNHTQMDVATFTLESGARVWARVSAYDNAEDIPVVLTLSV